MPSVNGSYWLLTALSTQLYMLMYMLMFCAAMYLKYKNQTEVSTFKIPGGKVGMAFTCVLGLLGCLITFIVGFIPPSGIDVGSMLHYELMFCSGIIVMILPVMLLYFYKMKQASPVFAN